MLRISAAVAAFALACASSAACAGDFMPRGTNGYAIADDPGSRLAVADAGATAPMSEPESPGPARAAAPVRAGHIGVDGAAAETRAATPAPASETDDKAPPSAATSPHKAHSLRWQSLLPGVMK